MCFEKPNNMYLKFLFPNKVLHFSHTMTNVSGITIRKLINTNKNTDEIFSSVNYIEFYRRKYSLGIYRGNYGEKKRIKTKQKNMMTCHLYQRNYRW
jgi:hypothetical protein